MTTTRKVDRRERDIKKKLSAAIIMLLLSCIMVVTSTYAWFTLSTAPEVKGIQTTIAGNGNLEIALANGTTWDNAAQVVTLGGTADVPTTNASWGNLVSIDTENYGTNYLRLAPAALSFTDATKTKLNDNLLSVPKYGADGRVSELTNAVFGATYKTGAANSKQFLNVAGTDRGLRALGISTAMTARQSSFMTTMSAFNNAITNATSKASLSLEAHGSELGNIAVKIATASDRNSLTFDAKEFAALEGLVNKTAEAVDSLDKAVIAAIKATIAGSDYQTQVDDATFALIEAALDAQGMTVLDDSKVSVSGDKVTFSYGENASQSVNNSTVANLITKVRAVSDKIDAAQDVLKSAKNAEGNYNFTTFNTVLNYVMNLNGTITVAGQPLDKLKDELLQKDPATGENKINAALAVELAQNCVIVLGKDSGVYYDIAELAGTVQAGVFVDVQYGGLALDDTPATIKSTYADPILKAAATAIGAKAPSSKGSDEANIISDFYAYALDLLFRTNASDSKLKLQTNPADRIYADNSNAETLGAGSTMTFFDPANASFNEEKMVNLINAIKIVFIDKDNTIIANAKLDASYTKTDGDITSRTYIKNADGSIIANIRLYTTSEENGVKTETFVDVNNQELCSLTANTAKGLSVLVYLDGNEVDSSDVANSSISMNATMNLQFSSSVELDPMDYSGLYIPGTQGGTGSDDDNQNGDQNP